MYYLLLYKIIFDGKDLPDNILIPFGILLLLLIINRSHRAFSGLTGLDIIITILLLKTFFAEYFYFDPIYIDTIKTLLLTYFAFRVGLRSKLIFNNINDVKLLKYSLFDMSLSILLIIGLLFLGAYFFFPIIFENVFQGILIILMLSFILTIGSKSLFKNFYAHQIERKELFKIPFALIDIHQLFVFILSGSFILFFNDHTDFYNFDQSQSIFIALGATFLISTFFGLILNKLDKKRELNVALLSFTLILSGLLTNYSFSPMFIPFFIGAIVSYFINDEDKYHHLTNNSKSIISSSLIVIMIIEIDIIYNINFYMLVLVILLLRFILKFLIQKLSSFYFDTEQIAIPGLHMLFLGQGKTSVIILMYFLFSFDHVYANELKIIAVISVIVFEFIGLVRSKPEHIISNKTMMKEIDT